jgi:mono/diheme cytochrome c family protein
MTECHGPEGMALNFGSEEKPQFIGSVAEKNPWEFIHKARTGQPGTRMSSGILNEWTDDDFRNLLTYSRSLPKTVPEPGWLDRIKSIIGLGKEKESSILQEHRGFGPKIDQ